MAHIVYVTNGMSSTLNSSLELSRRLAEAGHRITYVSHLDLAEAVSAHGHDWVHWTLDQELDRELAALPPPSKTEERGPGAWLHWIRRRRALRARSARAAEFEATLRGLEPDLLIVDMELHLAVLVAASLEVPLVLAIVWFSVFHAPGLPPMNTPLLPADGWTGRLRVEGAWLATWLRRNWTEWKARLGPEGVVRRLRPVPFDTLNVDDLKEVARERDFDRARHTSRRHWLWPWVYPRIPVLAFNLRELEFPHAPHPGLHYVGPMVARERREVRADPRSRRAWDELLERRRRRPGRPLVYGSLGSHWSADTSLLEQIVAAAGQRPGWDLVLGLGGKLEPEALEPLPENVTALTWAPQLEILSHASACITHGGITSINECLAFGVPMVVVSTEHVDQDGCAARVAYHGAGLRVARDRVSVDGIRDRLDTVLSDPEIRRRVETLQRRIQEVEQERPAVRLIEEMLEGRPG